MGDEELWPTKWDREKIEKMRRDPVCFASQVMGHPLPRNEIRFPGRGFGRTVEAIERVVVLAECGIDVSKVMFVCATEEQARRVMRELVKRLGPKYEGMPQVKP